jgi:hypothetical protein
MTDIPGTSKIAPTEKKEKKKLSKSYVEKLATVNIREIEKAKNAPKLEPEDTLWYNRLRYWVLFGTAISFVFIPFALIVSWRFLFLLILGPLSGWISWYIKMLTKKFGKETDIYTRRY